MRLCFWLVFDNERGETGEREGCEKRDKEKLAVFFFVLFSFFLSLFLIFFSKRFSSLSVFFSVSCLLPFFRLAALCATMAGAAPAASAAGAAEHTRGTLVWVRPQHQQQGTGTGGASKAMSSAMDDEEWVKATVSRVLDDGATLEVSLEGSGGEDAQKITVSSSDAPLQNPASRLGVEVRQIFFGFDFFFDGEMRERKKKHQSQLQARHFFFHPLVRSSSASLRARRDRERVLALSARDRDRKAGTHEEKARDFFLLLLFFPPSSRFLFFSSFHRSFFY